MLGAGAAAHAAVRQSPRGGGRGGSKDRTDSKGSGGGGKRNNSKEKAFIDEKIKAAGWGDKRVSEIERELNDADEMAAMIEKYSKDVFYQVEALPAVVLMNHGRFDDLSVADVKELFLKLDADQSGALDFDEIELFLKEVLIPPCTDDQVEAIYELTDKADDHQITYKEFFRALTTGAVKTTIMRMQQQNHVRKEFQHKFGLNINVERALMLDRFKWAVGRDDAFQTLPFSIAKISIFVFLVVAHMKIWHRQQLERGIASWIEGYGAQLLGPYLQAVANVDGMYDWTLASGLPAILGNCHTSSGGDPFCYVGTRNTLIGDVELRQQRLDESERSVWLLHSMQARDHLQTSPGDYLGAATLAVSHLRSSGWADLDTTDIRLSFGTFGARSQLLAMTDVYCRFDAYGYAVPRVSSTAVVVNSYPLDVPSQALYYTFDGFFCMFIFFPMIHELRDMIRGMRIAGLCDGFWGYMGLWNFVDWLAILCGSASIFVWILVAQAMAAESVHTLLRQEGTKMVLTPGIMALRQDALEKLFEDLSNITSLMNVQRTMLAVNVIAIMLKFFKAFTANPRLQLVTRTITKAMSDILHFFVVFLSVFIGFAITGHILMGNDMKEFRSFSSSIDTCFIVLMGEFEWYVAASESSLQPSSGMPYAVMAAWFWLYMIGVLMILLNMLLAIILDHYTELVMAIKLDVDVKALWEQTFEFFRDLRHKKDHIHFKDLCILLEDDDTPCHTMNEVTENSLREAFPKMKEKEAEHVMLWLKSEAKKMSHDKDDECMARLKMLEKYVSQINEDISVVKLNTAVCTSKLQERKTGENGMSKKPIYNGPVLFTQGHADQFVAQVDTLTERYGAAIRELNDRITKATTELASKIPPKRRPYQYSPPKRQLSPKRQDQTLLALPANGATIAPTAPKSLPACWAPGAS